MKKSAAPKVSPAINKDRIVNVRFTFDDFAAVVENARQSGLTVSEWIRRTSTKTPVKKTGAISQINRRGYLVLSVLLLEFSELAKLIKRGEKFADFRNGVIERTLIKMNLQILEIRKKLI